MTYYEILEVAPNASIEVIKVAYKTLMRVHHPDVKKGADDAKAKVINEAFGVLSDPQKREDYDGKLAEEALRARAQQHGPKADPFSFNPDAYKDVYGPVYPDPRTAFFQLVGSLAVEALDSAPPWMRELLKAKGVAK